MSDPLAPLREARTFFHAFARWAARLAALRFSDKFSDNQLSPLLAAPGIRYSVQQDIFPRPKLSPDDISTNPIIKMRAVELIPQKHLILLHPRRNTNFSSLPVPRLWPRNAKK